MQSAHDSSNGSEAVAEPPAASPPKSLVRNTLYLTLGNAATIPISVASNALLGRYLGAEEFGYFYLAGTLCGTALLALEWGQAGAVPTLVTRTRGRAPVYLGTSLVWRLGMGTLVMLALLGVCRAMGYDAELTWVVMLTFPIYLMNSCAAALKDTVRGFERTDIPAIAHVGTQVAGLIVLLPVLLAGGRVRTVLVGYFVVAMLTVLALRRSLGALNVRNLRCERAALTELFSMGTTFVFFDIALVLPPYINASFMSKNCPPEVIGWYGVAQRLVGLLIFPATAINGALYPTLARLHVEDQDEFARVVSDAVYGASLLALPAAVGCGLFPEIGVSIFGSANFEGSIPVLQVLSLFVLLVYVSMPIGTSLMAGNRRRAWTIVQGACVVVCLAGNPVLLPYFQRTAGNGAIGAGALLVLCELMVVGAGVALVPKGVFSASLLKSLALTAIAGGLMALVGWLLKPISLFLAVPAATLTYVLAGYQLGAIRPSVVEKLRGFVARKLRRA